MTTVDKKKTLFQPMTTVEKKNLFQQKIKSFLNDALSFNQKKKA